MPRTLECLEDADLSADGDYQRVKAELVRRYQGRTLEPGSRELNAVNPTPLFDRVAARYPDLPRQGPEPDGDTVKFLPDIPALVDTLPRRSGRPADINARGISVRLEAIDALETHFQETHQELAGANAARDELLAELGFTNFERTSFVNAPAPDWPGPVGATAADRRC